MRLIKIFLKFLKIGAFGFGGGYAMLTYIYQEFVEREKVITPPEFNQSLSLSQFSPGAMVVNTSAHIGYRLRGIPGLIIAAFGMILPSFLIIILFAGIYLKYQDLKIIRSFFKGIYPAIIALLVIVVLNLWSTPLDSKHLTASIPSRQKIEAVICGSAFLVSLLFHLNSIIIIIFCAVLGILIFSPEKKSAA